MAFLSTLFRHIKYGDPVIVVSGLPRSGTSMLMKMLESGGLTVWTDSQRQADDDNPKGYFELERVKTLDKGVDKSWVRESRGKVLKVISFLLKDLPSDNFYKVIFVRRNLDEVLASQNKMLVNRGETKDAASDEKMKQNYETHLRKTDYFLKHEKNFEVLYLDHRQIIENGPEQARKISAFLGGSLNVDAMAQAVDPALYRNRA